MTAKLDPRPGRNGRNLTSRECSKALGGLLGGVASVLGAEQTRELLKVVDDDRYWKVIGSLYRLETIAPTSLPESTRVAIRSIGGLVAGLCTTSSKRAVRTAVRWWAEKDEAWRFLDYSLKNAGNPECPPFKP